MEIKETLRLNSSISRLVLKQESRKNLPNRPESYMNGINVNLTQKGTELFYDANKKNLSRALRSKNEWSLFFSDDLVISPTSKSAE